MMDIPDCEPLGEVIRADSRMLEAESHALYRAPDFGSFIRVACPSGWTQFAVVTHIATGPLDGNRIVQAHRLAPGELEQRKPHLTALLRTTFQGRLVACARDGGFLVGTPPSPPRLHCFIYPAAAGEIRSVTGSPAFLRSLVQTPDAPLEDLLVAAIGAAQAAWDGGAPVIPWGRYLGRLLRRDYVLFEGVLQRLSLPELPLPVPADGPTPAGPRPQRWEGPLPLTGNGPLGDRDPFE